MLSQADKNFAKMVFQLFKKYQGKLVLDVKNQNDSHLDVEIRIVGIEKVGFRAVVNSTSINRSEEDPDPRGFGDTAEVTRASMVGWYPGKRNSWTENRRSITLQAWNLPSDSMPDYTANYEYDPEHARNNYNQAYEVEQIFQLLTQLQKTNARKMKEAEEKKYADEVLYTFDKLLKK